MRPEPYLTENPFRILGLGSDSSFDEVKKAADTYGHRKKVGLALIPLEETLGQDPIERMPDYVRKVAQDDRELVAFRLFWPYAAGLIPVMVNYGTVPANLPEPEQVQANFSIHWIRFLETDSTESLSLALEAWHQMEDSKSVLRRLANGWNDQVVDTAIIRSTIAICKLVIVERALSASVALVVVGKFKEATSIIETILTIGTTDTENQAFSNSVRTVGDQLEQGVLELTEAIRKADPRYLVISRPLELECLERLLSTIQGDFEPCVKWERTAKDWYYWIARKLYDRAIFSEKREGVELLYRALSFGKDTEFASTINEKITELVSKIDAEIEEAKSSARNQSAAAAPQAKISGGTEDVRTQKLSSKLRQHRPKRASSNNSEDLGAQVDIGYAKVHVPKIRSWFGTGTKIFKRKVGPENSSLSFAVMYITILNIPTIPISRHVVQDIGTGKFIYFQRTKWTVDMGLHLGVLTVAIVAIIYFIIQGRVQ